MSTSVDLAAGFFFVFFFGYVRSLDFFAPPCNFRVSLISKLSLCPCVPARVCVCVMLSGGRRCQALSGFDRLASSHAAARQISSEKTEKFDLLIVGKTISNFEFAGCNQAASKKSCYFF